MICHNGIVFKPLSRKDLHRDWFVPASDALEVKICDLLQRETESDQEHRGPEIVRVGGEDHRGHENPNPAQRGLARPVDAPRDYRRS